MVGKTSTCIWQSSFVARYTGHDMTTEVTNVILLLKCLMLSSANRRAHSLILLLFSV